MTQIILSVKYDWRLVALSIGIAIYASYTAFDFASRIADAKGHRRLLWAAAGAIAMGLGMWSMQCVGMLAMVLPVAVNYSVPLMACSFLAAVGSSSVALLVVGRKQSGEPYFFLGSLAMGGGIAALHYVSMAALQFAASKVYNPGFVGLSIVIAFAGSGAALQLARLCQPDKSPNSAPANRPSTDKFALLSAGASRQTASTLRAFFKRPIWLRLVCASVMTLAIGATHYMGMAAVSFRYDQTLAAGSHAVSGPSLSITGISLLTVAVLVLSLVGSRVERKFAFQGQMLLSEQERWLLVVSASSDGLFDFDLLTGQVFYSPRWKAIIGYNPDELDSTFETWRRCLHPDDRQAAEDNLERYLRGGQGALEMEYRVGHRDGSPRWILMRAQAVWDEQGKPVRLVGYHSDITSRKENEEKLLASETRYRGLFEANPLPSWIYSPTNLQIQDANQAAMDYFGWSRERFLGMNINSIRMPGEDAVEPGASDPRPKNAPWRLRRKNKSGIWVELSNYDIEGAEAPARLMIANDVTAHVVHEAKIEKAKDKLEGLVAQKTAKLQSVEAQWNSLVDTLPQLVWSTLPDGACDFISSHWSRYTGVPAEKLLGSGWLETVHPADRANLESSRLRALETSERYTIDYRIRKKDGTYHRLSAQVVPVRSVGPGEPITHWLGTSTKIEGETHDELPSLVEV
jgi:PAS domain S-box-containing protein